MKTFQEILKLAGLKTTTQRLEILKILKDKGHISIDEIHREMMISNPFVALTAIYRNIDEMMKHDIVTEIKLPRHKPKYEIKKSPHIHLVCQECEKITDASVDTSLLFSEIELKYGCKVLDNIIVLNIICMSCIQL
jgi:Fe2+ or Zn2+ uptake regulation protein